MKLIPQAIDSVQQMYLPSDDASPAQKMMAIEINNRYTSAMHWMIYERMGVGNLNRYPLNCEKVRRERPFANLLIAYLELCKGCHELARNQYPKDPATHWSELVSEIKKVSIDKAIAEQEKPLGLQDWVKLQAQIRQRLESRKNPFSDSQPLYFNLMQCACHLAEKSIKFRAKYWVPYLAAYQENYLHCDRVGAGVLFISEDRILQTGRGKPTPCKVPQSASKCKDVELARYYCLSEAKRIRGKGFQP